MARKAKISNGNRTEWRPIRSVIMRVINKIGRPRSESPICFNNHEYEELDDTKFCYRLIKICDIYGSFFERLPFFCKSFQSEVKKFMFCFISPSLLGFLLHISGQFTKVWIEVYLALFKPRQ